MENLAEEINLFFPIAWKNEYVNTKKLGYPNSDFC